VYNQLGYGFLESVYQKALLIELRKQGLKTVSRYPITVYYDKQTVGEFEADLIVEDSLILELKAVHALLTEHEAQLLNYLNATGYEVGLLLNFGPQAQIKRKVFDNDRKK
jgi:GxxExxY protein